MGSDRRNFNSHCSGSCKDPVHTSAIIRKDRLRHVASPSCVPEAVIVVFVTGMRSRLGSNSTVMSKSGPRLEKCVKVGSEVHHQSSRYMMSKRGGRARKRSPIYGFLSLGGSTRTRVFS